jgi:hypothetical protein
MFILKSVAGRLRLELDGEVPRNLEAWDAGHITARLVGDAFSAVAGVDDMRFPKWGDLFEGLAGDWRGWDGVREEASAEGHLRLSCSSDYRGHVSVRVQLAGDFEGCDWSTEATLFLDAGSLETIAAEARAYFG